MKKIIKTACIVFASIMISIPVWSFENSGISSDDSILLAQKGNGRGGNGAGKGNKGGRGASNAGKGLRLRDGSCLTTGSGSSQTGTSTVGKGQRLRLRDGSCLTNGTRQGR